MIRTDGRPTIAMRESEPLLSQIEGQMTVEDCIAQAEKDERPSLQEVMDEWDRQQAEAGPIFGGF